MANRHGQRRNSIIWAALTVVVMAVGIPPYFYDQPCSIPSWMGHSTYLPSVSVQDYMFSRYRHGKVACVRVGEQIGTASVTAVLIGKILTARVRLQRENPFRNWTLFYVTAVTVHTFFASVVRTWCFAWCPQRPFDASVVYAVGNSGAMASYFAAQGGLFRVAILRLEMVDKGAARRAKVLLCILLTLCVGIVVWMAVLAAYPEAPTPSWGAYGLGMAALSCLVAVIGQISLGFAFAVQDAAMEARRENCDLDAVVRVKRVAVASALSGASTIAYGVLKLLIVADVEVLAIQVLHDIVLVMDIFFDAVMVLSSAGIVGVAELQEVGQMAQWNRLEKRLSDIASADTGPEMAVAALIGGITPQELMKKAKARFRCISWDVLAQHPEIILNGQTLATIGPGKNDLYTLSTPCQLSDCDYFWSHSWADDAELKWAAIKKWCEAFKEKRGRSPRLWLDKVCIDQSQIDEDLKCLPIFLGACNSLLVTSGPSYSTRLWCSLELFVYMTVAVSDERRKPPIILTLGADRTVRNQVRHMWQNFDVEKSECFREHDKKKILKVMNRMPGRLPEFNMYMQELSIELLRSATTHMLEEFSAEGLDYDSEVAV